MILGAILSHIKACQAEEQEARRKREPFPQAHEKGQQKSRGFNN